MRRREFIREKFFASTRYFQMVPVGGGHGHTHDSSSDHRFHATDPKTGELVTFKTKGELEKFQKENRQEVKAGNKEDFRKQLVAQKSESNSQSSIVQKSPASANSQIASTPSKPETAPAKLKAPSEFVKPSSQTKLFSDQKGAFYREKGFVQTFSRYSSLLAQSTKTNETKNGEARQSLESNSSAKESPNSKGEKLQTQANATRVLTEQRGKSAESFLRASSLQAKVERGLFSSSSPLYFAKLTPSAQRGLAFLSTLAQNPVLLRALPIHIRGVVFAFSNLQGSVGSFFFPRSFLQRFLASLQKFLDLPSLLKNLSLAHLESKNEKEVKKISIEENPQIEYFLSLFGMKGQTVSISFLKQLEKSLLKFLSLFLNPISSDKFLEGLDETSLRELGILMMIQSRKLKKKKRSKKTKRKLFDRLDQVGESDLEEEYSDSPDFSVLNELVKS